jgi:hypothetical protein
MEVDDDVKQLALQGKAVRAIQLLRERTGADFDQAHTAVNALLPSAHRMRAAGGGGVSVLLICGVILGLAVVVVVLAAAGQLAAWLLRPVSWALLVLLFRPETALLLAVAILVFGLRLARRFRQPARFRAGVITMALAVATFWPLQFVAGSLQLGHKEYNMFLHGLAFFISACLFTGGLEAMRRAHNTPQADSWEFLG